MAVGMINNALFADRSATTKVDIGTAATITNLASSKGFIRFTGATATELQGILAGYDGQSLTIYNVSTAIITFKNQNGGAAAADRIITGSSSDEQLDPNTVATLVYDSTAARWVLVEIRDINITENKYMVQTTNATPTVIAALPVAVTELWNVEVDILAQEGDTNQALYHLQGIFYRPAAGNVTQRGSTLSIGTIESNTVWDADFVANIVGQTIDITVTGVLATTIDWIANVKFFKRT